MNNRIGSLGLFGENHSWRRSRRNRPAGDVANGHEPVAYLADVLLRVREDMSDHELDALLPAAPRPLVARELSREHEPIVSARPSARRPRPDGYFSTRSAVRRLWVEPPSLLLWS
jgi:hypothetical protein